MRWAPWSILFLAIRFLAPGVWRKILTNRDTLWLVCWAFGGLVFMSLVPSKRIDRIFPVVPPLCLLLTALTAQVEPGWGRRLRNAALASGVIIAAATAVGSAALSYKRGEGAQARFGARVRAAVGASPGEVVSIKTGKDSDADDETMLVYLRRMQFMRPVEMVQRVSVGGPQWLVMREAVYNQYHGGLDPYGPWRKTLTSDSDPNYLLLQR